MQVRTPRDCILRLAGWLLVLAAALSASAAGGSTRTFDVAADAAERGLRRFAEQAAIHVIFPPELTDGVRTNAVKGELTIVAAADRLLAGTGLALVSDEATGVYALSRRRPPHAARSAAPFPADEKKKKPTDRKTS